MRAPQQAVKSEPEVAIETLSADLVAKLAVLLTSYRQDLERDPTAQSDARIELAQLLGPAAEEVARMVSSREGVRYRAEQEVFQHEALGLLLMPREQKGPRILAFDPSRPKLLAFLKRVLRRCWLDFLDRELGHPTVPLDEGEIASHSNWAMFWEASMREIDRLAQVPDDDLARLNHWKVIDRIELLSISGLFAWVPESLWRQWLDEFEQSEGFALPRPFPPTELLTEDDPRRRIGLFKHYFDAPRHSESNRLNVRWSRGKTALARLSVIRHLAVLYLEGNPDG